MSIIRTLAAAAPLLLAISACGDEPAVDTQGDGREASGEVLEGTISDAMLPVDQVRSQAPLVEVVEDDSEGGTSSDASTQGATETAAPVEATEAGERAEPEAAE
jgi:hypothetical protein